MPQIKTIQNQTVKKVLITGGTGFIGTKLSNELTSRGHTVRHLSRSKRPNSFRWDIERGEIDTSCVEGIDVIIHLAGASVADGRWSKKRKHTLRTSRIESAKLLYRALIETNTKIERFISASGTGYYGVSTDHAFNETDPPGNGFLSKLCIDWENSARSFEELNAQVTVNRIGVVMHDDGGFVAKLAPLTRRGLGAILGSGNQIMPWIHLDDLIRVFVDQVEGRLNLPTYNLVAPTKTSHKEIMKALAKKEGSGIYLPNVPGFVIKLALGELSGELLESQHTAPKNLLAEDFKFNHPSIESAFGIE